jgi:drug/metabolite transporter (DMT)-like permease
MRYILPFLLTFATALTTFWYASYAKKYQSLFLLVFFDMACFFLITLFAFFREGPTSAIPKLKAGILEPYFIPYFLLNIIYGCLWYFLTTKKGAAYTGVYESSYILILVLMNVFFKYEKFDLKFFLGASLVCIGIVIIELE